MAQERPRLVTRPHQAAETAYGPRTGHTAPLWACCALGTAGWDGIAPYLYEAESIFTVFLLGRQQNQSAAMSR